jgi:hypothetical protein
MDAVPVLRITRLSLYIAFDVCGLTVRCTTVKDEAVILKNILAMGRPMGANVL